MNEHKLDNIRLREHVRILTLPQTAQVLTCNWYRMHMSNGMFSRVQNQNHSAKKAIVTFLLQGFPNNACRNS